MKEAAIGLANDQNATKEDALYREAPYNLGAERAILGALLTNNEAINRIGDFLQADHFYEAIHQRIYQAIITFNDRGIVASPLTLKNHFDKDEALSDIGGAEYLVTLAGDHLGIINLESHARIVYDLAIRRNLIGIGENIVNTAFEDEMDRTAQEQIEVAEQDLFNLASEGVNDKGFMTLKRSLAEAIERTDKAYKQKDKISGVPTQFEDLDGLLGGLQNSDLVILAGRPSMGKTALAVNVALNACKALFENHKDENNEPPSVGVFSLEMSAEQLAARMLAMETGINSSHMRTGNLSEDDFTKLVQKNKEIYGLPLFIDDTPALTISAVRTRARRLKRKNNLSLLVIDYLQLLRGTSKISEGSRVQEISEITQGLKAIAKELNIPVIALSQLSRAVEQREDKRPQLSDLRESGSIEQDADVVMFIFREEYYIARKRPPENDTAKYSAWQEQMNELFNKAEVIIAKQRNGPIGTVKLFFDGNTTRFSNLETHHNDADINYFDA